MKLNNSGVIFNEELHTYHLDGKELHGITKYIKDYICPDKYYAVPDSVLQKAAERGSEIHKAIEMMNLGFMPYFDLPEYVNYRAIIDTHRLNPIANEYTVTDRDFFATNIDCVYECDGKIVIADYKTTAKLDHEYLRWQLSINAYLFELQNPHLKADTLIGIWLRGEQYACEEYERIDDDTIREFLSCAKNNSLFVPNKDALAIVIDVEREIIKIEQELKRAEERKKKLQEVIRIAMENNGTLSLKTENLSISYRKPSTSMRFDSTKFKAENEELYKKYLTPTEVKASVKITIKNGKTTND